jgi:hypothetical protein
MTPVETRNDIGKKSARLAAGALASSATVAPDPTKA